MSSPTPGNSAARCHRYSPRLVRPRSLLHSRGLRTSNATALSSSVPNPRPPYPPSWALTLARPFTVPMLLVRAGRFYRSSFGLLGVLTHIELQLVHISRVTPGHKVTRRLSVCPTSVHQTRVWLSALGSQLSVLGSRRLRHPGRHLVRVRSGLCLGTSSVPCRSLPF